MAGTPATITCGLNASSKISIFNALAAYEETVLFLLGINLQSAWLNGPKENAGKTVPSTIRDKSIAA